MSLGLWPAFGEVKRPGDHNPLVLLPPVKLRYTPATMATLRDAVLVGYVRTPFGRADPKRGVFRAVRSDDLAVVVLHEVLRRTGVATGDVEGIILGAVEMMGEQAHPGHRHPVPGGFPDHVVGLSVERACTTAMMSVHIATMQIQCGLGDVFLAGGLDSMTHFRIPTIRDGMDMAAVIKEGGHMLATMNPEPEALRPASIRSS